MTSVPSHADQLLFLTRAQKILDEGQFVATCKFALLASCGIARWAYERARSTSAVVRAARGITRVMPAVTEFAV